jgi:hypothetical protein
MANYKGRSGSSTPATTPDQVTNDKDWYVGGKDWYPHEPDDVRLDKEDE